MGLPWLLVALVSVIDFPSSKAFLAASKTVAGSGRMSLGFLLALSLLWGQWGWIFLLSLEPKCKLVN
jgi:hypothetical protein